MATKMAASFLTACMALSAQADDGQIHDVPVNDNDGPLVTDTYPGHIQAIRKEKPYLRCAPMDGSGPDQHINEQINLYSQVISYSKAGAALWDEVKKLPGHIWICPNERLQDRVGDYDYSTNVITLNGQYSTFRHIPTLAHELRHAYQRAQSDLKRVDDEREYYRLLAMEADASVMGALVVWELKEVGFSRVWRDATAPGDLYRSMGYALADTNNGWGGRLKKVFAVFEDWRHDHDDDRELNKVKRKLMRESMQNAFREWFENDGRVSSYQMRTADLLRMVFEYKKLLEVKQEICELQNELRDMRHQTLEDCSKQIALEDKPPVSNEYLIDIIKEMGDVPGHDINYLKPEEGEEEIVTMEAVKKAVPSYHRKFMP